MRTSVEREQGEVFAGNKVIKRHNSRGRELSGPESHVSSLHAYDLQHRVPHE